jgi:hypothetical protein
MEKEKPSQEEKPIGPSEAFENASRAIRMECWEASTAWSLLGLLALKRREDRSRGR